MFGDAALLGMQDVKLTEKEDEIEGDCSVDDC